MSGVAACPQPRVLASQPGKRFRCRRRTCPSCGLLWAGDTRRKILANVAAYAGDVVLVTVTAPGRDRLPTPRSMVEWNLAAPAKWRTMNQRSRQHVRRSTRSHVGLPVTMLGRSWEYQKRGALHVHVVLGVKTAAELAGAHEFANELAGRRSRHDFGFVDRGRRNGGRRSLEIVPAERAARYLAKYLSPLDAQGKPTLSATVTRRDVPAQVVYVNRELTTLTGVTMRWLRWCRQAHVLGIDPRTGELLEQGHDQVDDVDARPPLQQLAHAGPTDL